MIPVENGQRTDVLSRTDIDNMALEGRDTTELLMSLPGAVTDVRQPYADLSVVRRPQRDR